MVCLDLSAHFRYSSSFRDHEIYLYFSDKSDYVPLLGARTKYLLQEIQLDYIQQLSNKIYELKFYLNQDEGDEESPIIQILRLKKKPINNRYILFEDINDFAAYCLLSMKDGRVMNNLSLLKYFCLCQKKNLIQDVAETDALNILIGYITAINTPNNPLKEGQKKHIKIPKEILKRT